MVTGSDGDFLQCHVWCNKIYRKTLWNVSASCIMKAAFGCINNKSVKLIQVCVRDDETGNSNKCKKIDAWAGYKNTVNVPVWLLHPYISSAGCLSEKKGALMFCRDPFFLFSPVYWGKLMTCFLCGVNQILSSVCSLDLFENCAQTNWMLLSITEPYAQSRRTTENNLFLKTVFSSCLPWYEYDTGQDCVLMIFKCNIFILLSLEIMCKCTLTHLKIVICKPWKKIYISPPKLFFFFTEWHYVHFCLSMNHRLSEIN